jgi:hypothetical protein
MTEALNLTLRTIEKRMRNYRNLVIAVTALALLSFMCLALFRRLFFLYGFILLVPLVGGFFVIDTRTVRRWRSQILDKSRTGELDLELFLKTAGQLQRFSPSALQNMLSTVRAAQKLKGAELAQFEEQQRKLEHRIVLVTLSVTLALTCLMGSILHRSLPILLCGIGFAIPAILLRQSVER